MNSILLTLAGVWAFVACAYYAFLLVVSRRRMLPTCEHVAIGVTGTTSVLVAAVLLILSTVVP